MTRLVKDIGILAVEVELTHVTLQQLRHWIDVESFARWTLLVVRQSVIHVRRPGTESFVTRLIHLKFLKNLLKFKVLRNSRLFR